MPSETKTVYYIKTPQLSKKRFKVEELLSIGSDASCDVRAVDLGLSPLHGRFRFQNDVLTFTNLSSDEKSRLNDIELGHGRSYILEKGDQLFLSNCQIGIDLTQENLQSENHISDKTTEHYLELEEEQEIEKEESKKKSIIQNLLSKIQRQKTLKLEKKKEKKHIEKPLAGFLMRSCAFSFDIILFLITLSYFYPFIPTKDLSKLSSFVLEQLKPILEQFSITLSSEKVETFSLFIILYFSWNLVAHLIFSNSAALFLMGATNSSSFLRSKILTPIRALIGYLTFIFLIFDLPIIFGKRTFKEVATGSIILKRSSALALISACIVLPLIIFIALTFPFAANYDVYIAPPSLTTFPTASSKKAGTQFLSDALKLTGQLKEPSRYQFIPSAKGKDIALVVRDKEKTSTLFIQRIIKPGLSKTIESVKKNDLFFPLHSPHLNNASSSEKNKIQEEEEMSALVEHSLLFSFSNITDFVLNHGPIIYPYYQLQKETLKRLEVGNVEELEKIKIGANSFFVSYPSNKRVLILKPTSHNTQGWLINNQSQHRHVVSTFLQNFFSSSHEISTQSSIQNGLEAFYIYDVLYYIKKRENLTKDQLQRTVSFFTKTAYEIIQEQNEETLELLKNSLLSLDKFLLRQSSETQFPEYNELRLAINTIQKAVIELDLDFFKLNLQPVPTGFEEIMDGPK